MQDNLLMTLRLSPAAILSGIIALMLIRKVPRQKFPPNEAALTPAITDQST